MGPSSCRKTSSRLLVILHNGALYNYFVIYHNPTPGGFPCASPSPTSSELAWVPAAGAPLSRQAQAPWEGPAVRTHLEARPVPAAGAWGHSASCRALRPVLTPRPLTLLEGAGRLATPTLTHAAADY